MTIHFSKRALVFSAACALALAAAPLALAEEMGALPPPPQPPSALRFNTENDSHPVATSTRAMLEHKTATTTKPMPGELREMKEKMPLNASTTKSTLGHDIKTIRMDEKTGSTTPDEARLQMRLALLKHELSKVVVRFTAALERLKELSGRIASRINKFHDKGADMTKAEADLVLANSKIIDAETAINTLSNFGAGISASTTEAIGTLKSLAGAAEEKLKAGHQALVKVVTDMKPAAEKLGDDATTTDAAKIKPNAETGGGDSQN